MLNTKEKILLYSNNLWVFGEGMLGPFLAVFTEKIGGNILNISWAWAIYLITTGILIFVIGKFSDARKRKEKLMLYGFAFNALFTYGYLFVSSVYHLFIVQIGLGLAAALSFPTWNALYAKYEDRKHDGYTWGLVGSEAYIAAALAIILGGLIINYFSFNILFLTMGSIQLFAALYVSKILSKK